MGSLLSILFVLLWHSSIAPADTTKVKEAPESLKNFLNRLLHKHKNQQNLK